MSEKESQIIPSSSLSGSENEPIIEAENKEKHDITPEQIKDKLEQIARDKYLDVFNIIESAFKDKGIDKDKYNGLIDKLNELSEKELGYTITEWKKYNELSKEELESTQSLYDFLNLDYNLKEHIKEKGIDIIPKEQKDALLKEGYNYSLIIPGDISRDEFLNQFQASFAKEFSYSDQEKSEGLHFYDNEYQETQTALDQNHILRPSKPYQIMLRLPKDKEGNILLQTSDVQEKDSKGNIIPEFDTMGQTFGEYKAEGKKGCLKILEEINGRNPVLNLKGLTLPESLIFQASVYHQAKIEGKTKEKLKKYHLDANNSTWLLEELIYENGEPVRSLDSVWRSGGRCAGVGSNGVSSSYSGRGARFAALPKKVD